MKKYRLELKWGLIFAGMMLMWMLMERLAGLHSTHIDKHPVITNLIAIPAFVVYFLALREKREVAYSGVMTWAQGFKTGLVITLVVTLLTPLTQVITTTIITPHYFENVIEYSVANDLMSRKAAESYFNLKNYLIQSVIGAPIMGVITSAILAIFTMKKM